MIDDLNSSMQNIDREFRTVNGVEFKTIEEAKKAKCEYQQIKEILNSTNKDNEKSLLNAKSKIQNLDINKDIIAKSEFDIDEMIKNIKILKKKSIRKKVILTTAFVACIGIFISKNIIDNSSIDKSDISKDVMTELDSNEKFDKQAIK